MSKDAVEVVRTIEELWNADKLDALDEYFAPSFESAAGFPGLPPGLAGAKMAHQGSMQSMPDRKTEIQDIFSDGKKVCVRIRLTGTNTGGFPIFGAPANDAKVDFEYISIYEVEDGQITGHWGINDALLLLVQLGVWAPSR